MAGRCPNYAEGLKEMIEALEAVEPAAEDFSIAFSDWEDVRRHGRWD